MKKISSPKLKILFLVSFILALLSLTFLTIQFEITYTVVLLLMIPIIISIFIYENRSYLIFSVLMLFSYSLLAIRSGLDIDRLVINIILLTIYILFTSEFIKRFEAKRNKDKNDIKQSEEEHKNQYGFIKTLADNSPDLFWAKDLENRYTFANKAMCKKLLCAENLEEPIGKTDIFFAERERAKHPENKNWHTFGEQCRNSDLITIDKKTPQRFDEFGYVRGEFLFLDVYKTVLKNADGKIIGTIGTGRDVTKEKEEEKERKKTEEALKGSEQKFRELIENLNEIICTVDENGKVTYVNNAFEKLTGFSKEVLMESHPEGLVHPEDYEKFMEEIARVQENKKIENFEYRAKTALGTYRNFLTTVQPLKLKNGKYVGLIGVASDITKIKEAEKVVQANKKKLDTILSTIPDLLLIFDAEGNYLDVFPQDSNYLIVPFTETRGKNLKSILPPAIAQEFMTIISKAIETNSLINYRYALSVNGNNVLFNARVKKIIYEGKTAVLWDAHDITAENKIMKILHSNEKKFENLLKYTYDWEYWTEPNGKIGYTSPSCKQQTGYEAAEFLAKPELLLEIVHPNDKHKFNKHLADVNKSKGHGKIQFKIIKKNGEIRVIRHTCQAVFDDDKYIGRRVTNRNATDRWNAEQKLEKSEKEYKSIFNSLIDVYYRIGLDGTVENVSPSVEKISGYKREEIIGKNASVFYLFPELRMELYDKTLKEGTIQNYEIEMKDKSGKIKTVSFNNKLVYGNNQKIIAIEGMLRDVTQLKNAREELFNAKNEIQNYLSIARVMILVLDKNGNVKLINRKGCKILGYEEKEILGKNWVENFVPQASRIETKKVIDLILDGKYQDVKTHENEIIIKSGELRTIRWHNAYLEDKKKEITGILSSGEDITNEKKLLSDLRKSEKNFKELNEAKDKFFSIISHDIRSPFTALLGFTQILDEDYDSLTKEETEEIAHSLKTISNNIFEFIEGLLEWSRVQSNKIEINPIKLNLYHSVQGVFVLLSTVALAKKVKIKIEVQNGLEVFTDENVVETVLRNLISNAIKFTSEGDIIKIYTEDAENDIIVCVSDTGTGMTDDTMNKLFKLDEHVSERGTNMEKGTGLGLLLCKDLLNKQQNKIWVESKLNKGSTFKFTLKKANNLHNKN